MLTVVVGLALFEAQDSSGRQIYPASCVRKDAVKFFTGIESERGHILQTATLIRQLVLGL